MVSKCNVVRYSYDTPDHFGHYRLPIFLKGDPFDGEFPRTR
jgi:hypothetical protein